VPNRPSGDGPGPGPHGEDPVRLHAPTGQAGQDRTDRQRIGRKAARRADRYGKTPPGERLAAVMAMKTE